MSRLTLIDLSDAELADLALCGITSDAQLQARTAAEILRDLEQAGSFFPDHEFALTEERLIRLCGTEEKENVTSDEKETEEAGSRAPEPGTPTVHFKRKKNLREEILQERRAEEHYRRHRHDDLSAMGKLERMHGLSSHFHAIHCSHPHRVYFGAWATLLLILPFIGLLVVPFMLLTGQADTMTPVMFGAAFVVTVAPWFMIARSAQCGVCHMPLFSFKHYSHHRMAHHLPLIGYTFTTALHIIMLFWFRCPACGTQMKLFGRSRHRR